MNTTPSRIRANLTNLIVLAAFAAALGLWLGDRFMAARAMPKLQNAALYPQPRPVPDFALTQANGKPLANTDWQGHWNVVYFGYTSCPDVCPTAMGALKQVWVNLKKTGLQDKLRIDFISVDPERDTPAVLARYVGFFSPDFIAATGTDAQLTPITSALGLIYTRGKNADGSIQVDHSGSAVIIDPQARVVGIFRPPFVPSALTADLTTLITGK